ncbi:TPA: hypothetical protein ACIFDL_002559 [Acinetobacter nosocomialis]
MMNGLKGEGSLQLSTLSTRSKFRLRRWLRRINKPAKLIKP